MGIYINPYYWVDEFIPCYMEIMGVDRPKPPCIFRERMIPGAQLHSQAHCPPESPLDATLSCRWWMLKENLCVFLFVWELGPLGCVTDLTWSHMISWGPSHILLDSLLPYPKEMPQHIVHICAAKQIPYTPSVAMQSALRGDGQRWSKPCQSNTWDYKIHTKSCGDWVSQHLRIWHVSKSRFHIGYPTIQIVYNWCQAGNLALWRIQSWHWHTKSYWS